MHVKSRILRRSSAPVAAVAFGLFCSLAWSAPIYRIHLVSPTINNRAIEPGKPLPDTCKPGTGFRVMACRGEYEPFSFVIETEQLLEQVDVRVTDLRTGSGATLPGTAVDVRVVAPVFRRITDFPGELKQFCSTHFLHFLLHYLSIQFVSRLQVLQ